MNQEASLSSIVLPSVSLVERDLPVRAQRGLGADPANWQEYDRRTLVYDAIYLPNSDLVRLYLPRLLNLQGILLRSRFFIDGQETRPTRHKVFRRFEVVDFRHRNPPPERIEIETESIGTFEARINPAAHEAFKGRRVVYTLLRNEKLEWIRDWLTFHQAVQGADAVLIADNGSTSYSSSDLREAIAEVPGYVVSHVVSVPLPWGPRGAAPGVDDGKYLQTALLNLMRDRFLLLADGVLNLDVDELLLRLGRKSVFDQVKRWGFLTFPGEWRYPDASVVDPLHRDHIFRDSSDKPCATKYCFRPSSLLGRMCLSVHSLEHINRRLFSGRRQFTFLHCRNISTGWKYDRTRFADGNMKVDPATVTALDAVYGRQTENG
ncbi:hypothetical protein [Tabrizicola thermarum]|uniref:hypothetical protein n=1 Tax=Tabrizicola thermarum TaxID=2670345 RepID=UPI000FFBC5A8|nr:hypothetical protein [Tabrizicola thermarum]